MIEKIDKDGFYRRLREMRVRFGDSQAEAAKHLKRNQGIWSRIERGDAKAIPLDLILAIAEYAASRGVSCDWLFRGVNAEHVSVEPDSEWLKAANDDELVMEMGRMSMRIEIIKGVLGRKNKEDREKYIDAICQKK